MTAATYTSRTFAPTSSAALRVQRALAALAVCLPVPICAASGLSLPLPATVERIAAALVPWADAVQMSANEALPAGAKGSIVERADGPGRGATLPAATPGRTSVKARASVLIPRPGMFVAPAPRGTMELGGWKPSPPNAAGSDRPQPTSASEPAPVSPESPAPDLAPAATPAPTPVATSPSEPAPAPTSEPDPIAPVTNIVEPVVEPIVAPVAPIVEETTSVVKETVAPITGLLSGLGKP
jgi:hypothetical protein